MLFLPLIQKAEMKKKSEIVASFFDAYSKHDMNKIAQVMDENVTWHFNGSHPYSGVKNGLKEVIAFFDDMAQIMSDANLKMEKLITAENDNYFIECQQSQTQRENGPNLSHYSCVLWSFKDGKITEGRHFFSDQESVNNYFNEMAVLVTK